jgi:hypothetical protein
MAVAGDYWDDQARTFLYLNSGVVNLNGSSRYLSSQAGLANSRSGALAFADYDKDGYMDVMILGNESGFRVYRNNGNLTQNTPPSAPTGLTSNYADGKWTFTWNRGADAETPVQSLRYNIFVKIPGTNKVFTAIPADISTGYLKQARINAALTTTSYSIELPYVEFDWGVQTIDNGKLSSAFATATTEDPIATQVEVPTGFKVKAYVLNSAIFVESSIPAFVSVYDMNGQLVASADNVTGQPVGNQLKKGVYIVRVQTKKGSKVIKVIA